MATSQSLHDSIIELRDKHNVLMDAVLAYRQGGLSSTADTLSTELSEAVADLAAVESSVYGAVSELSKKPLPSLILDFESRRYLTGTRRPEKAHDILDVLNFKRPGVATYVGSNGRIQTAASGEPRIAYDPANGKCLGLMVEDETSNILRRSCEFDDGYWNKTAVSIVSTTIPAPDGSDALYMKENSNSGSHEIVSTYVPVSSGKWYCRSVYAKLGEGNRDLFLESDSYSTWHDSGGLEFDLSTGTMKNVHSNLSKYGMEDAGNGWYLCWVAYLCATDNDVPVALAMRHNSDHTYQGDGNSGIYLWGAQFEAGDSPSSRIKTGDSVVTREADSVSLRASYFPKVYNNSGVGALHAKVVFRDRGEAVSARAFPHVLSVSKDSSYSLGDYGAIRFSTPNNINLITGHYGNYSDANGLNNNFQRGQVGNFVITGNGEEVWGYQDGGVRAKVANRPMPIDCNTMNIGFDGGRRYLNGYIKRITYYPVDLSPDEALELTSDLS